MVLTGDRAYVSALHTQMFSWLMPSAAVAWAAISGPLPSGRPPDSLADGELAVVRGELEEATAGFRTADGTCTFPVACRLFWGAK